MDFKELHHSDKPLLLGNVWDVSSAKTFEKLKFDAIGTSSAAIAHMLGYEDGGKIAFAELEYIVGRIISTTSLPLSVDIENGYSNDPDIVIENIRKLYDLGVSGINIEDSVIGNSGKRQLVDARVFAQMLDEVSRYLKETETNMFVNVRTDAFLIGIDNALDETLKRLPVYERAGADGIFVPCIETVAAIKEVVRASLLPVNVMCMPGLPDFEELQKLGVRRISMGNFLHQALYQELEQKIVNITDQQSFNSVF